MRINLKTLSLFQQTLILFGGFLVLAVINFIVIDNSKDDIISSSHKIVDIERLNDNVAKLNIAAQQAMDNGQLGKDNLEPLILRIDQTINAFKHGGQLPFTKIDISPADNVLQRVLDKYESSWSSIKTNLAIVMFEPHERDTTIQQAVLVALNDSLNSTTTEIQTQTISIENQEVKAARNYLKIHLKNLAPLISELEEEILNKEAAGGKRLNIILWFFLVFNGASIIIVLILIKKSLFNPLNELGDIFSNGNFDRTVSYSKQNEIGILAVGLNNLVEGLKHTTSFVSKIGEGKLDEKIEGLDETQVIQGSLQGALLDMREQMKLMDAEDEKRKWTTEGLAKFVDILRASDNVQQLGDAIISNLVEYTSANQGGMYTLNAEDENNTFLELISLYAFNKKKFDKKHYKLGEGLVGQTYLEKKSIFLLEVPDDYIEIKSGLGDANPKNILLVPLKIENDVYGVIELASFHEFEEHHILFVEKLGESIAATIAAVKNNHKTKLLLEDSQQLTEQMRAQEEEMRQNMEELSATQEEMARKEIAVTAQLELINNSLGTAEYNVEGEIITTNTKFYESLGYNNENILNVSFYLLHNDIAVFEELKKGNAWSGWLEKKHKSGKPLSFKSSFSTIYDDHGAVIKIIELITQFEQEGMSIEQNDEREELKEVEEELRQNLEELSITQEQLDKKLITAEQFLQVFKTLNNLITIDSSGTILEMNERATLSLGTNLKLFGDVFEESITTITDGGQKTLTLKNADATKLNVTILIMDNNNKNMRISIIWT
jgi:PAS domain-containing protein